MEKKKKKPPNPYEIELRSSEYTIYEINQGIFMVKVEGVTSTMEFCNTGV